MSKKVPMKASEMIIQSVIAAGLGMAVTMLLLTVTAFLVYRRGAGESTAALCVRLSVAAGCLISSAQLGRKVPCGFLLQTAVTAASFLLLVIISSSIGGGGDIIGNGFGQIALFALVGSAAGAGTKLVKSNKSYDFVIKKK